MPTRSSAAAAALAAATTSADVDGVVGVNFKGGEGPISETLQ